MGRKMNKSRMRKERAKQRERRKSSSHAVAAVAGPLAGPAQAGTSVGKEEALRRTADLVEKSRSAEGGAPPPLSGGAKCQEGVQEGVRDIHVQQVEHVEPERHVHQPDEPRPPEDGYLSPKELAKRWSCSASSVRRIARRAGMHAYFLGEGRNGMVRYSRKEVAAFEQNRRQRLST